MVNTAAGSDIKPKALSDQLLTVLPATNHMHTPKQVGHTFPAILQARHPYPAVRVDCHLTLKVAAQGECLVRPQG